MSDELVTGKGIMHAIEKNEYPKLTKEKLLEIIEELSKPSNYYSGKPSMFCGKPFLQKVFNNNGGKDGLIIFLKHVDLMTNLEGMEYLREVVPELFKEKENDKS